MESLAMALPVKPGKAAQLRAFRDESLGSRRQEFEETEKRLGITREAWYLQPSPMGDLFVMRVEGDNLLENFNVFVGSSEPMDVWSKQQMLDITGIDFNQPPEGVPEVLLDWSASGAGQPKATSIAMALPVKPGQAAQLRTVSADLLGARRQEFEKSEQRIGIPREAWYLQPSPMGDLLLIWAEADDIVAALTGFIQSRDPFDVWLKQQVLEATGIDLNQPPESTPEALMDWSARAAVR
jgi:hypothetical protein